MSAKSRMKQATGLLYVVQDITNANADHEPETLNIIFNSREAAEQYIGAFGKPGLRVEMIGRAVSLGDIQRMKAGRFEVAGSDHKVDTAAFKKFRSSLFTGVRRSEMMNG